MPLKINLITSHLKKHDGQSNVALRTIRYLKTLNGIDAKLITFTRDNELVKSLESENINVINLGSDSLFYLGLDLILDYKSRKVAKYLDDDSFNVVISDDAVFVSKYKKGVTVYWCQGLPQLMPFLPSFFEKEKVVKTVASLASVPMHRKILKQIKNYDLIFSNAKATSVIMSLFYGILPNDVLYPPVYLDQKVVNINNPENYALVIVKRDYLTGIKDLIEKISEKVPVKIVGNVKIGKAMTLGRISDDELYQLYANAYVLLYQYVNELFGMIPVESMITGTPVIAFNSGGPSETIINNETGWLVNNEKDFINKTIEIFENGYDINMRLKAHERGKLFSMQNFVSKLLDHLYKYKAPNQHY